jgi:hypothetical protein
VLAALLLAGIIAAPLSSVALFLPVGRRRNVAGAWPATRRLVFALAGTALVAAAIAAALTVIGVAREYVVAGVAGFVVMSLLWLPATRRVGLLGEAVRRHLPGARRPLW